MMLVTKLLPIVLAMSLLQEPPPQQADEPKSQDQSGAQDEAERTEESGEEYEQAEELLKRFRGLRSERAPVRPSRDLTASKSSTEGGASLLPEGDLISRRAGRLIKDTAESSPWWIFVFESDHPDRPEPPMKVLPSQYLEWMIDAQKSGTPGVVFVVSGEVTVFHGENYLLPRAVSRRPVSVNLSR